MPCRAKRAILAARLRKGARTGNLADRQPPVPPTAAARGRKRLFCSNTCHAAGRIRATGQDEMRRPAPAPAAFSYRSARPAGEVANGWAERPCRTLAVPPRRCSCACRTHFDMAPCHPPGVRSGSHRGALRTADLVDQHVRYQGGYVPWRDTCAPAVTSPWCERAHSRDWRRRRQTNPNNVPPRSR